MADTQAQSSGTDANVALLQQLLDTIIKANPPATTLPNQAPIAAAPATSTTTPSNTSTGSTATQAVSPADLVTRAIANSGQLISAPPNSGGGKSNNSGLIAAINQLTNDSSSGSSSSSSSGSSSGGLVGGAIKAASSVDGLTEIGSAIASLVMWIICTELVKQKRLPYRYWIVGAKVFAAYPEKVKNGYYFWAIPSVKHIRAHPYSFYSNLLCSVFNWRAENIAAHRGIKGARKLISGALVTAVLWPVCYTLGCFVKQIDWRIVYKEAENA